MIEQVKRFVRGRFPNALGAFHEYRQLRRLQKRGLQQTPFGFHFRGHEGMEAGTFEPAEVEVIRSFCDAGSVFVDVGANFGYFVCLAARRGSHVIAVEPLRHNLDVLYTNLQANGFNGVEVFPVGLAGAPGLGVLYGGGTGASLLTGWAGTSESWRRTIPLSTLDAIVGDRFGGAPMLIKIDVEGFELSVLDGAERTLGRKPAPRWLVEICLTENYAEGCNPRYVETFSRFWNHGYRARSVEAGLREVTPGDAEQWVATGKREFGYVSFLFEK